MKLFEKLFKKGKKTDEMITADQALDTGSADLKTSGPAPDRQGIQQPDPAGSEKEPETASPMIDDSPDTVWISPDQAASIIKGDRPLSQDLILTGPGHAERDQTDKDLKTGPKVDKAQTNKDPKTGPKVDKTQTNKNAETGPKADKAQTNKSPETGPQDNQNQEAAAGPAGPTTEESPASQTIEATPAGQTAEATPAGQTAEATPAGQTAEATPAGQTTKTSLEVKAGQAESPAESQEEEEAPVIYRRNPRKGRRKNVTGKLVFSLLVLLAAAYLGGRYFFQTHFLPNTYVDGTDLGLHSQARAREILDKRLKAETLELIEPDENEYLTGADVGLHYVSFDKINDIMAQQDSANWFLLLKSHTDYGNLDVAVNPDQLSASVDKLHCLNPDQPIKPENAQIYYHPEKHKYKIKSETYGNLVNKEPLLQGLSDAFISRSPTFSMQDQAYYIQADIRKDSEIIQAAKKKMNTWLKGTVVYKDGDLELKLSRDEISSFIKLADNYKVSIDKKKVKKYVKKKVVKTFNSLEGDIPDGLTAWKVDVKKETKALIKDIKEGKKVTRAPVYSSQGLEEDEYNLGSTYIDVNLSQQQMWYVEDGKVAFNSDVVTGNVSSGHATSTGIYHIAYKQRNHMMVKYHSFVHYWMPYNTAVGIGFHDASWRSSFGGEIYRYDGSHGCINMPPPKAEELFNMISSGTTVYVHD